MSIKYLDILFNPQRIAVLGASEDERSIGYHVFRNLIGKGYTGIVHPVNGMGGGVQGVEAYPRVADIPHQVDLAMLAVTPKELPAALEDCREKGVKGIVIMTPDYKYRVTHANLVADQIRKLPSMYGCRVLGPDSMGFLRPAINLNASLYPDMPKRGNIAFISESGMFSTIFLQRAMNKKVGFSYFISIGSKFDINISDIIDFLGGDPSTRAIFLHVAMINNGRRFMTAIRSFAKTKPIVVVKPGKGDIYSLLSVTHSGYLAEEDLIYDAVFKRAGSLRVDNMVDLLYMIETTAKQNRPKGKRLMVVTNSVAPSEMATDVLKEMGGELALVARETLDCIRNSFSTGREPHNPLYLLADAGPEDYRTALEAAIKDRNVDGILVICVPFPGVDMMKIAETITDIAAINPYVPLFVTWHGEETTLAEVDYLNSKGFPTYYTPEQAVKSFMYMHRYDYNLKLLQETPEIIVKDFCPDLEGAQRIIRSCLDDRRFVLRSDEAVSLLRKYGIEVIETVTVTDDEEATAEARRIGFPVILKISSATMVNRVQKKAVLIDLKDEDAVRAAFLLLKNRMASFDDPGAQIIIQPMVSSTGYQLAVGARKSENFGTVILFGLGGEYLRAEKDYAIGLPPLNQTLAKRMMEETRVYRYLQEIPLYQDGLRRLEEMLLRFSQLVIDLPQIGEIDINPMVLSKSRGILILNVDIHLDRKLPREYQWSKGDLCPHHLLIPPYPFRYEKKMQTRDGEEIEIRPIRGEDEPALFRFFDSLSNESIYYRFGQRRMNMPHDALVRYCQVDYDRDLAFLAVLRKEDEEEIIGDVRLNRFVDLDNAELSFVVGENWQGKGIGGILMEYCIEVAREIGLKTLWMEILKENIRMIKFGRKYGFVRCDNNTEDDDMVEVVLNL